MIHKKIFRKTTTPLRPSFPATPHPFPRLLNELNIISWELALSSVIEPDSYLAKWEFESLH